MLVYNEVHVLHSCTQRTTLHDLTYYQRQFQTGYKMATAAESAGGKAFVGAYVGGKEKSEALYD